MNDNEIRLVHREETFNDLAVRELARGRSACICRIQFGACKKQDCSNCNIGLEYRNCYNQMNDYDRVRLSKYVSENYVHDSARPGKWMGYKGLKRYMLKWTCITLLCLLALIIPLLFMMPGAEPDLHINEELDARIVLVITKTFDNIRDINSDGEINCVDYAITFKLLWDLFYPNNTSDCIIIRNYSYKLHHLFIGIYQNDHLIFVEPWSKIHTRYLMRDNWSDEFDPRFNIYGETDKWLKEIK